MTSTLAALRRTVRRRQRTAKARADRRVQGAEREDVAAAYWHLAQVEAYGQVLEDLDFGSHERSCSANESPEGPRPFPCTGHRE